MVHSEIKGENTAKHIRLQELLDDRTHIGPIHMANFRLYLLAQQQHGPTTGSTVKEQFYLDFYDDFQSYAKYFDDYESVCHRRLHSQISTRQLNRLKNALDFLRSSRRLMDTQQQRKPMSALFPRVFLLFFYTFEIRFSASVGFCDVEYPDK